MIAKSLEASMLIAAPMTAGVLYVGGASARYLYNLTKQGLLKFTTSFAEETASNAQKNINMSWNASQPQSLFTNTLNQTQNITDTFALAAPDPSNGGGGGLLLLPNGTFYLSSPTFQIYEFCVKGDLPPDYSSSLPSSSSSSSTSSSLFNGKIPIRLSPHAYFLYYTNLLQLGINVDPWLFEKVQNTKMIEDLQINFAHFLMDCLLHMLLNDIKAIFNFVSTNHSSFNRGAVQNPRSIPDSLSTACANLLHMLCESQNTNRANQHDNSDSSFFLRGNIKQKGSWSNTLLSYFQFWRQNQTAQQNTNSGNKAFMSFSSAQLIVAFQKDLLSSQTLNNPTTTNNTRQSALDILEDYLSLLYTHTDDTQCFFKPFQANMAVDSMNVAGYSFQKQFDAIFQTIREKDMATAAANNNNNNVDANYYISRFAVFMPLSSVDINASNTGSPFIETANPLQFLNEFTRKAGRLYYTILPLNALS